MPIQYWPFKQSTWQAWGLGFEKQISVNHFTRIVSGTWEDPDKVLKQLESQGYEVEWANQAKRVSAESHVQQQNSPKKTEIEIDDIVDTSTWVAKKVANNVASLIFTPAKIVSNILWITEPSEVDKAVVWLGNTIPRTLANIVNVFNKDAGTKANDFVDDMIKATGIDPEDKVFKGGETVGQVWSTFVAPQLAVTKVAWLLNIAKNAPKVAKALEAYQKSTWLSKFLSRVWVWGWVWAVETQGFNIANEWELATTEETLLWGAVWGAFWGILSTAKWLKNVFTRAFDKTTTSAKNISLERASELVDLGERSAKDITIKNPIASVADKVSETISTTIDPILKWAGKEIGKIRDWFKAIPYETNSIMWKLEDSISDLGLTIKKTKAGKYSISWPVDSIEKAKLNDMVDFIGKVADNEKFSGNMFWAEKINRYISKNINDMVEKSKLKEAWIAIAKFWQDLWDDIVNKLPEDQAKLFSEQKGKYSEYVNLIKESGKEWERWLTLIKKWLRGDPTAVDFFNALEKDTWINLLHEAELARFIQVSLKDKEWVVRTLGSEFYPSTPWMIMVGIKAGTNKLFDSITEILKKTDWFVDEASAIKKSVKSVPNTAWSIASAQLDKED